MTETTDMARIVVLVLGSSDDPTKEVPSPEAAIRHMRARDFRTRYKVTFQLVLYQAFVVALWLFLKFSAATVLVVVLGVGILEAFFCGMTYLSCRRDIIK
jgi:hypothetical protein